MTVLKLHSANQYWANFFNISPEIFISSKITVIPHASLKGYNGAWIFKRNQTTIISVPEILVGEVRKKVEDLSGAIDCFSQEFISYLFGKKVDKTIGPAFQGYYSKESVGGISPLVRALDWEKDQALISELANSGDSVEWNHASIDATCTNIYGYMMDGKCVAISGYKLKLDLAGFIGVYTAPDYRGQGLGKEVVKAVVKDILEKGYVPLYQTLMENVASIGIAERLGIHKYAEHLAIRLQ